MSEKIDDTDAELIFAMQVTALGRDSTSQKTMRDILAVVREHEAVPSKTALQSLSGSVPGFLEWVAARFIFVHGEDENVDFVLRLQKIAGDIRSALEPVKPHPDAPERIWAYPDNDDWSETGGWVDWEGGHDGGEPVVEYVRADLAEYPK